MKALILWTPNLHENQSKIRLKLKILHTLNPLPRTLLLIIYTQLVCFNCGLTAAAVLISEETW